MMHIKFILGPMCSEKSDRLIKEALTLSEDGEVIALKSVNDIRDDSIQSRTGATFPCTKIRNVDLMDYLTLAVQTGAHVLIDEGFMFESHLKKFVEAWSANANSTLVVSSLDRSSENEWFECIKESLPFAHVAEFRRADCDSKDCHMPATRTWHYGQKTSAIQVDESTSKSNYSPRCEGCWKRLFVEQAEAKIKALRLEYLTQHRQDALEGKFDIASTREIDHFEVREVGIQLSGISQSPPNDRERLLTELQERYSS